MELGNTRTNAFDEKATTSVTVLDLELALVAVSFTIRSTDWIVLLSTDLVTFCKLEVSCEPKLQSEPLQMQTSDFESLKGRKGQKQY